MKLDASIADYKEEMGELSRGGHDDASNVRHESSALIEDLRGMVNNPEFSDVSFVCKDSVHVHASRMFLAARSSVFKQMFFNGMTETRSSVIPLPSVGSSAFIQVLKFLYAGELETSHTGAETDEGSDSQPSAHDWKLMVDVLSAAQFFLLDRLVKVTLRRMWDWLGGEVTVQGMLPEDFINRVAYGLTELCAYTSSSAEGTQSDVRFIEAICIRMVQILISSDMSKLTLSKLSKKAFTYYLDKTFTYYLDKTQNPPSDDKVWKWSLEEYKKLFHVHAWSTIKAGEEEGNSQNLACLPDHLSAGRFLLDGNKSHLFECRHGREAGQGRQSLSTDTVKKNVQELLPFIDLTPVHPELLIQVIRPLKIIDAQVADALDVQAGRTSGWFRNSMRRGSHNWFFQEEWLGFEKAMLDYVICKMECNASNGVRRVQTFMANSPMHSYGIYKWRIAAHVPFPLLTSLRDGPSGFEFGFLRLYPGEELTSDASSTPLSDKIGFSMHVMDDVRKIEYCDGQGPSKDIWNLQAPFNLKRETVLLLDRVHKTLQVTCNGYTKSIELKIPEGGLLYPAICLPDSDLQVAIQFLDGFDQRMIHDVYDSQRLGRELISPRPLTPFYYWGFG